MYKKMIALIMSMLCLLWPYNCTLGIEVQCSKSEVRLEDDFYTAMNKEWLSSATIKEGYTSVSNFSEITDQTRNALSNLFEDILTNEENFGEKSIEKKMIHLYGNYLNKDRREEQGNKPIQKYIDAVKQVKSIDELNNLLQEEPYVFFNPFYQLEITTDIKDSDSYMLVLEATQLHLGDSACYRHPTEDSLKQEKAVKKYMHTLLKLSGYKDEEAEEKVERVMAFEKLLAPYILSMKEVTTHPNIYNEVYNTYTLEELELIAPKMSLASHIKKQGYDKAPKMIVEEPKWLEALNTNFTEQSLEVLKDCVEINIIEAMATYMSSDYGQAINTYKKELYGIEGNIPIEQEAFELVNNTFSNAMGKLYVEKYFSKKAKKDLEKLVDEVLEAYENRIEQLPWMSECTKVEAIKKLKHMNVKIGYPNKWENYKGLEIKSYEEGGNLVDNIIAIVSYRKKDEKKQLGKKVDRTKFLMSPQTVNACYSPTQNAIIFPAAILQPPFYDAKASKEQNLGGIGAVIAHEVTHAFDHHGAQFDEKGNLSNWWTDEDYKHFEEKANEVRNYYNTIEIVPGKNINGDLTVGENIADIGAIACILDIMAHKDEADYKEVFESWAKIWRVKMTENYQMQLLKYDPHAPNKARVNHVLMQFDKFHQTYDIKEGDEMYLPEETRLRIW